MASRKDPPDGGGGGGGSAKRPKLAQGSVDAMSDEDSDNSSTHTRTPTEESKYVCESVVFVERMPGSRYFSDEEIRYEMEKFFPDVSCKAYMQKDKSVRIQDFRHETDAKMLTTINWSTHFGDKGVPFGQVQRVHEKTLPSPSELARTVAILVSSTTTEDTVERRLTSDFLASNSVTTVKKIGKNHKLMRVVLRDDQSLKASIERGVCVGYRATKAMSWSHWKRATTRCFKCQKRANHQAADCTGPVRCPRCSGRHGISECNASILRCPNCGGNHAAWSFVCPQFSRAVRQESRRNAIPFPSHFGGVTMNPVYCVEGNKADGRQFAAVAAGRRSEVAAAVAPDVVPARQLNERIADPGRMNFEEPAARPMNGDHRLPNAGAREGFGPNAGEHKQVRHSQELSVDVASLSREVCETAVSQIQKMLISVLEQIIPLMSPETNDEEPARKKSKNKKGKGGRSVASAEAKKPLHRSDGRVDWKALLQFAAEALTRHTALGSHPLVDEPEELDLSDDD